MLTPAASEASRAVQLCSRMRCTSSQRPAGVVFAFRQQADGSWVYVQEVTQPDGVVEHGQFSGPGLALDGQEGSDTYIVHGGTPPSSTVVMNASIDDTGNPWDQDLIKVLGTSGADKIIITDSSITFDLATDQVVTYTAPTVDPIDSVLQIKVFGYAGNDDITVESTADTVAVRVESGGGDDLLTVGDGTVDGILGTVLPN